jgi:hypothetical protein
VTPLIVDWFVRHLSAGDVLVHERTADSEVVRLAVDTA